MRPNFQNGTLSVNKRKHFGQWYNLECKTELDLSESEVDDDSLSEEKIYALIKDSLESVEILAWASHVKSLHIIAAAILLFTPVTALYYIGAYVYRYKVDISSLATIESVTSKKRIICRVSQQQKNQHSFYRWSI